MSAYCENESCEYYEDGYCESEKALRIDCNGFCSNFRYRIEVRDEE